VGVKSKFFIYPVDKNGNLVKDDGDFTTEVKLLPRTHTGDEIPSVVSTNKRVSL
jgi:hypothetical protein